MTTLTATLWAVALAAALASAQSYAQGNPTDVPLNPVARFTKDLNTGGEVIPQTAVPAGKTLILTYANVVGFPNSSALTIEKAGCVINLRFTSNGTTTTAPFGGMPVQATARGAAGSEMTYIPLVAGEGIVMSCSADIPASFHVMLAGYFVPSSAPQ